MTATPPATLAVTAMLRRTDARVTGHAGGVAVHLAGNGQDARVLATLEAFGYSLTRIGDTFVIPADQLV